MMPPDATPLPIDSPDPFLRYTHKYVKPRAVTSSNPAMPVADGHTLLLLHGTGGDENDLLHLGESLLPGAGLLSPRGRVLENGAARFFRRIREGVFDEDDVRRRANELTQFVVAASENYKFDLSRLIAVGYSNGANIAAAIHLLHPGLFAGSILLRPMMPLAQAPGLPLTSVPILMLAGRLDTICPPPRARALADALQGAGADVRLEWVGAGHSLTPQDMPAARQWLATTLRR